VTRLAEQQATSDKIQVWLQWEMTSWP